MPKKKLSSLYRAPTAEMLAYLDFRYGPLDLKSVLVISRFDTSQSLMYLFIVVYQRQGC